MERTQLLGIKREDLRSCWCGGGSFLLGLCHKALVEEASGLLYLRLVFANPLNFYFSFISRAERLSGCATICFLHLLSTGEGFGEVESVFSSAVNIFKGSSFSFFLMFEFPYLVALGAASWFLKAACGNAWEVRRDACRQQLGLRVVTAAILHMGRKNSRDGKEK